MKLIFKRFFQILIITLISYLTYCNYQLSETWVRINKDWFEPISIINFKNFKKDQYFSLNSTENQMDQSYFLFGKILYTNNKDSPPQNIIHIRHLNKDSLVINNSLYQFQAYLRIPDSLKCSKKIDLSNKLLEFKVKHNNQLFTDTIYSTEKHQYIQNNNYNTNEKYSEKWIRDEYQIKDINGFKIIFYNMNTYAIIKKYKENLFFYKLTKNSIVKFSINEIKLSDKLKIEIDNKIKKDKVRDSIYANKHQHLK